MVEDVISAIELGVQCRVSEHQGTHSADKPRHKVSVFSFCSLDDTDSYFSAKSVNNPSIFGLTALNTSGEVESNSEINEVKDNSEISECVAEAEDGEIEEEDVEIEEEEFNEEFEDEEFEGEELEVEELEGNTEDVAFEENSEDDIELIGDTAEDDSEDDVELVDDVVVDESDEFDDEEQEEQEDQDEESPESVAPVINIEPTVSQVKGKEKGTSRQVINALFEEPKTRTESVTKMEVKTVSSVEDGIIFVQGWSIVEYLRQNKGNSQASLRDTVRKYFPEKEIDKALSSTVTLHKGRLRI